MKYFTLLVVGLLYTNFHLQAQAKENKVRLAKLVIDSASLEEYKHYLAEEITASLDNEPGVITLFAVSEEDRPNHITILEIYASEEDYQKHIESVHFIKYKNATNTMVKSLQLVEVEPLIPGMQIK